MRTNLFPPSNPAEDTTPSGWGGGGGGTDQCGAKLVENAAEEETFLRDREQGG